VRSTCPWTTVPRRRSVPCAHVGRRMPRRALVQYRPYAIAANQSLRAARNLQARQRTRAVESQEGTRSLSHAAPDSVGRAVRVLLELGVDRRCSTGGVGERRAGGVARYLDGRPSPPNCIWCGIGGRGECRWPCSSGAVTRGTVEAGRRDSVALTCFFDKR